MLCLIAASMVAAASSSDTIASQPTAPSVSTDLRAKAIGGTSARRDEDEDEKPKSTTSKIAKTGAADEDDDEGEQVGAIVITARRLDAARTSIDEGLGATVYNLHNETIENRPGGETGSISSILTQAPGVTLSSSAITIRGSKSTKVRINDVIIPEAISDPEDRLSSRLAESTRLISGTLPAQFDFAPGGVIAVTTKNGLYQHGGQAELFTASRGAFEPAFEWGGSSDTSSLFTSGSLEAKRTRVADVSGPSATDKRREIGGLAFADHVIDENNRVSLILGGSHERHRIGATDLPAGIEQSTNAYAVGTYQHSAAGFTLQASLFAGHGSNFADFGQRQAEATKSVGTQIDSSLETSASNTVRAGLLLSRLIARESDTVLTSAVYHRTSLGFYVQDEWKPETHLTLNAGVRADWTRSLGSSPAVEPRASLVWTSANGFTAHAGYSRYASAPPLGEQAPGVELPNERDDYFDAGVQQKIGPFTFGLDAYHRSAHDLIEEHKTPGFAMPTAFGFSSGRFKGVELSTTFAHGPVSAWVNLSLARSQGRRIIAGANLFPSATLAPAADGRWINLASDRPLSASGGFAWRIGKLDLSSDILAGSGVVRTRDPALPNGSRASAFATIGVAAVYHVKLFDQPLDIRADLTNLANAHFVTNDARNLEGDRTQFAQGRAVMVGFEQGF